MKLLPIIAVFLLIFAGFLAIVPGFRFSIILCLAFATLCMLGYLLLRFPTPRNIRILKLIIVVCIIGAVAAGFTLGFIVSAANPAEISPCRYIIVLGAGVNGTEPSLTLSERITAAYNYLTANPESVAILSGGQGNGEDITEAACMYRELTERGISPNRLLLEEKSTSTMENLQFSLELAEQELGFRPKKVGIVSSEYHLFRAKQFAKTFDLDTTAIPACTTWLPLRCNYYLREIAAVWKYLAFGP